MIEAAMAVRFAAGANCLSSSSLHCYHRSTWSLEDTNGGSYVSSSCRLFHFGGSNVQWRKCRRLSSGSIPKRNDLHKNMFRVSAENSSASSNPGKKKGTSRYHPSEDIIVDSTSDNGGETRLTASETCRTIVESPLAANVVHRVFTQVNSKATLMFSSLVNDEVQENIIWPELLYITDEHGNIYFQIKNGEELLQNLTADNNFVQVLIGMDTMEMIREMELSGPAEVEFGIEELDDDGSDAEEEEDGDDDDDDESEDENYDHDDNDTEWVAVLDDEEEEDDSEEALGDWAKLETMRSSHPLFFANKLSDVASDDPIDWMEQPPASLAVQGVLRPAFSEEHSVIQKHLLSRQSNNADPSEIQKSEENNIDLGRKINGHGHESSSDSSVWSEESDETIPVNETSFYKLEMIKVQLFSGNGHRSVVEVEDYTKAQPDAIAHSAAKIISRLKAGGEKTTQALKSLCSRCKGIQVEEAMIIGVDSLGFDLRICSGTQIQTLRFTFNTRATSEYSAERLLNDLLFPRIHPKQQKMKQAHQNEF